MPYYAAPYNEVNGHQLRTSHVNSISGYWRVTGEGREYKMWVRTHNDLRQRAAYTGQYKAMRPDAPGSMTGLLFNTPEEAAECVRQYCLERGLNY